MYSIKSVLDKNPIQLSSAIMLLVNFLVIAHIVGHPDAETVAAGNGALIALLGLFVATKTANKAVLDELADSR